MNQQHQVLSARISKSEPFSLQENLLTIHCAQKIARRLEKAYLKTRDLHFLENLQIVKNLMTEQTEKLIQLKRSAGADMH